jgi:SAM-dependent methyltransferase
MLQSLTKLLLRLERGSRRQRLRLLARQAAQRREGDLQRTNSAEQWAQVYEGETKPVTGLSGSVAGTIAGLTLPHEILLEAGCGSAVASAELATTGRKIHLLDFSRQVLDRGADLFHRSQLDAPSLTLADLTKPLPLPDRSVDVVWSSGVLEHWSDEELTPIVREMKRICRRAVISLVPSSRCVLYRLGKAMAEEHGAWPYGREIPRDSLRQTFQDAGLVNVQEKTVCADWAPKVLWLTDPVMMPLIDRWWQGLSDTDPVKHDQGYLLLTVGQCPSADAEANQHTIADV